MTGLTHLDESGAAQMVDVGGKAATARVAIATGRITMSDEAVAAVVYVAEFVPTFIPFLVH